MTLVCHSLYEQQRVALSYLCQKTVAFFISLIVVFVQSPTIHVNRYNLGLGAILKPGGKRALGQTPIPLPRALWLSAR